MIASLKSVSRWITFWFAPTEAPALGADARMAARRVWLWSIMGALLLGGVWWRCGSVPAASGGDEVWWSDAGYYFLKDGVLKTPVMADDKGAGDHSYWPPVLPIGQALFIGVFGMTPFAICAQSALHCTLLALLMGGLVRQRGGNFIRALAASIAVMAPLGIERRITQVRMESMTAVGALAFLWLLQRGLEASSKARSRFYLMGSGACLVVGLLSYYPHSPFLALATAAILIITVPWRATLWTIVGGLPFGITALLWVAEHPADFAAQVLRAGNDHYLGWHNLTQPFVDLLHWKKTLDWFRAIEVFAGVAIGVVLLASRNNVLNRRLGAMTLALMLPSFVFPGAGPVGGLALALVWLFSADLGALTGRLKVARAGARILLPWAGVAKVTLIVATALWQFDGRDYRRVQHELRKLDLSQGGVAISQSAWLALRDVVGEDRLHYLVYSSDAGRAHMPMRAKGPSAMSYFDHVVLETVNLDALKTDYPWLNEGLRTGYYQKTSTITLPFRPLPWAKQPVYSLEVYTRAASMAGAGPSK